MDLTLDERFYLLLHKKIMDKKGSASDVQKNITKINIKKTALSLNLSCLQKKVSWKVENAVAAPVLLLHGLKNGLWKW